MARELTKSLKLQVPASKATAGPPLGPALSQYGVNAGEFVNQFNEKSKEYTPGMVLRVILNIFNDRSFNFQIKGSPTSELIRQATRIKKGSDKPNLNKVGKLSKAQLEEIATKKLDDFNTKNIEQAKKIVAGTAKQMGVEIEK